MFYEAMQEPSFSSTSKSSPGALLTFRDLLQTPLSMEQVQLRVSSENNPDPCRISPVKEDEDYPDNEEGILSPGLATLDEDQEQLEEVNDTDSTSIIDGMERLMLDSSSDTPLNKPIRSYVDETLPDLLRSGSPLRRRMSSPVSTTLKQVRKEVELSRRRSLKLKAQVDKLQEQSQDGLAWSRQRDRVTEEIQSTVKLLLPLTDLEQTTDLPAQGSPLDTALLQLQNVSRNLALSHTSKRKAKNQKSDNDCSILQQALRDRDEALAKKKAMESELLKSKTELMTLNNQLLEAVQRRLEMAIELEAWKDDVQVILQHQLQSQQQAEQAHKKSKGFGTLRRSKQASLVQSPALTRVSTSISQSPNTPVAQRWKERLRRGRNSQQDSNSFEPQSPGGNSSREKSFQTVSLD